mgnify:CR=1 FL=1
MKRPRIAESGALDGLNDPRYDGSWVTTDQKDGVCRKRPVRVLPGVLKKTPAMQGFTACHVSYWAARSVDSRCLCSAMWV